MIQEGPWEERKMEEAKEKESKKAARDAKWKERETIAKIKQDMRNTLRHKKKWWFSWLV